MKAPKMILCLGQHLYDKSEADRYIAHINRKRCESMAKWCRYWAGYWETCEPSDCSMFIIKARYYRKWLKRWLKLAKNYRRMAK